jgi:hypothetical protein
MKINFAWVGPEESFLGSIHGREDERIFHLEIGQKEGAYARARVVIQNPGYGLLWPSHKQHAFISFDGDLVFRGRLIGMPSQIDGELVTLDFTAIRHDSEAKKKALCQEIKDNGVYDRLFFTEEPELKDLLQAYTALSYWNRTTGDLMLSDIFRGRQHKDLGGHFFRDSLKVTVAHEPLQAVNLEMKTEWMQQARGVCEIGHHIKRACRGGYLSSLTGESLEKAWWNEQTSLGSNGYRVEQSHLKPLKPLDKKTFPSVSDAFWHGGDKPKKVQFPRKWYDLQLRLGWSYRQKRRELALLTLKHNVQDLGGGGQRTKTLQFCLASILGRNSFWEPNHIYTPGFQVLHEEGVYKCIRRHQSGEFFNPRKWVKQDNHVHVHGQAARATFFPTDRGQEAIAYALEVAKAHLAASARCIHVNIAGHLNDLKDITLDHNLTIHDPRLPGGTVKGKVIGYRFIVDGQTGERLGKVRLGVSIGTGMSVTEAFRDYHTYAEEDVWDENPNYGDEIYNRSTSTICFRLKEDQIPPMGIQRPAMLTERELVQHMEILNDGDKQNRKLIKQQYPKTMDMKGVLKLIPTDIRIKLKDLKTYGCLDHTVHIDVLTAWSAPQHINLSAETNY